MIIINTHILGELKQCSWKVKQLGGKARISTLTASALKSSLKPATRLQLDLTKTAKDQTCSLGLSVLRLEDHEKTHCGGLALLVKDDLLYPSNDPSKRT